MIEQEKWSLYNNIPVPCVLRNGGHLWLILYGPCPSTGPRQREESCFCWGMGAPPYSPPHDHLAVTHTHSVNETGNNEHYWWEVINYWACSLQLVFKWFCPAGSARVVHLTSTLRPIDYSGQQLYFPAVESTATTVYVQEPAIVERSVSLPFPRVILITGGLSCCTHTWHATWLLYHLLELPTPALPTTCSSNISLPR